MKNNIRYHALRLFDKNGFHGTSIRDIADAAGCKAPTVYHHYENKDALYDEVVRSAYIEQPELPQEGAPEAYFTESLLQILELSEDGRLVNRLAYKTMLGCEGCEDCRQKLMLIENEKNKRNESFLSNAGFSEAWIKIISAVCLDLTVRSLLFDEPVSENEIRETLRFVFAAAGGLSRETKPEKSAAKPRANDGGFDPVLW